MQVEEIMYVVKVIFIKLYNCYKIMHVVKVIFIKLYNCYKWLNFKKTSFRYKSVNKLLEQKPSTGKTHYLNTFIDTLS